MSRATSPQPRRPFGLMITGAWSISQSPASWRTLISMSRTGVYLAAIIAFAVPAHAQLPKPLPVAVVDVRGFYGGLGQDPITAAGLAEILAPTPVTIANFPKRAPGGVIGVHLYLLRKKNIALGIGGEGVLTQGRAIEKDADGEPTGLVVRQRLQGTSGQVSLNFGHRNGWSYLSAGMGPVAFYSYGGNLRPTERPPFQMTINLGAGARWFATEHVAFCFDLRFYQTAAGSTVIPSAATDAIARVVAGIAIR
jgi:hypothetical protein